MEHEKDAFYVVRKGDTIGIYKSLKDCQAQLGFSVTDPSVSVYKGYCLSKEAEEYLVSHGLKNALYSIGATNVRDDIFGQLAICPFQQPRSIKGKALGKISPQQRMQHEVGSTSLPANLGGIHNSINRLHNFYKHDMGGPTSSSATYHSTHARSQNTFEAPVFNSCILEFDGASKGNPGLAGAGAVLYAEDGSMVWRLREGIGIATNNVAEYRAVILGLKYALKRGFKHIRVRGDSNLVVMQVQGQWKTKNPNMADLCKVAKDLKDKFVSFEIRHIERDLNSAADVQANLAIHLKNGEVQEDCEIKNA